MFFTGVAGLASHNDIAFGGFAAPRNRDFVIHGKVFFRGNFFAIIALA
jgi:hypothetical protein